MAVCGVEISGGEARLCIVSLDAEGSPSALSLATKKVRLQDEKSQERLKSFLHAMNAFAQENGIKTFVVKSRAGGGSFSAGAASFKVEALIQLVDGASVEFVAPQTLKGFLKKTNIATPPDNIPAYLTDAYQVAVCYHARAKK